MLRIMLFKRFALCFTAPCSVIKTPKGYGSAAKHHYAGEVKESGDTQRVCTDLISRCQALENSGESAGGKLEEGNPTCCPHRLVKQQKVYQRLRPP
jgi:hypothetical protein